jgi:hypothetical protein
MFCSLYMFMVLLQEIPLLSHNDILLYVRPQHYEPNIFILQEKNYILWETEGQIFQVTLKPKLLCLKWIMYLWKEQSISF